MYTTYETSLSQKINSGIELPWTFIIIALSSQLEMAEHSLRIDLIGEGETKRMYTRFRSEVGIEPVLQKKIFIMKSIHMEPYIILIVR